MLDTPSGLEMAHGFVLEPTADPVLESVADTADVSVGLTVVLTLGPVTEPRAVVVELGSGFVTGLELGPVPGSAIDCVLGLT